jgi:spectinomycin phosphotransferase/16S rRNA (guanine(1405)-N(7))-methyltransferase
VFIRPADLSDTQVGEAVGWFWSLAVESVAYAPVGFGSHHWLVVADGQRWFVTVDRVNQGVPSRGGEAEPLDRLTAALTTVRSLADLGMTFAVAPVPTSVADLLVPIQGKWVAALFPFVDGEKHRWGPFAGRSDRMAVLDLLALLHTAPERARQHAFVDRFEVQSRDRLETALTDREEEWRSGPYGESTRRLLEEHAGYILEQLGRYDRLVDDIASRPGRMVITHGEPHRANTITTASGIVLVDWDTVLVAPPERDVWWLAREDVTVPEEYERRTSITIDTEALELYRLRWNLGDLASFAAQFREVHVDNEDTRTAWDGLAAILEGA